MFWLGQAEPGAYLLAIDFAKLTLVATLCHAENVSGACFILTSKGATALASTPDVLHTFVAVFYDETKQIAGRNQYCGRILPCNNVL